MQDALAIPRIKLRHFGVKTRRRSPMTTWESFDKRPILLTRDSGRRSLQLQRTPHHNYVSTANAASKHESKLRVDGTHKSTLRVVGKHESKLRVDGKRHFGKVCPPTLSRSVHANFFQALTLGHFSEKTFGLGQSRPIFKFWQTLGSLILQKKWQGQNLLVKGFYIGWN